MKKLFYVLLFCVLSIIGFAQEVVVSGTITDAADGFPIPGVSVQVQNTTTATVTDGDGKYSINAKTGNVLIFSFLGKITQNIIVTPDGKIDVILKDDAKALDEVVVVGYGTMRKRDISGAVTKVSGSDLLNGNPTNSINQAMQGKIAGVIVRQNDGAPGTGISIQIRGANSFLTSTEPLYIVDGIPFNSSSIPTPEVSLTSGMRQTTNPLTLLNPQDIESIEILKDASATAIYGSRGANGVVLITTKRGNPGKTTINFSMNVGISNITKKMPVLNGYDYANYMNEQKINQSFYEGTPLGVLPYPGEYVQSGNENVYMPGPDDFRNGYLNGGTDWQDQIFQSGISQEYNIGLSGANDTGYYTISGNILDQKGIIVNSGYKRYTFRTNLAKKIHNRIELGMNLNYTNSLTKLSKTNAETHGVVKSALTFPPTRPVFDETADSGFSQIDWYASNPYMYTRTAKDEVTSNLFFSSSYLELLFTDYLKFRQNIGYSYNANARNIYYNRYTMEGKAPTNGFASQSDNWQSNLTLESILTFNKIINKIHNFNVFAAITYEKANYGNKAMTATNFPNDITEEYNMGSGLNPEKLISGRGETALLSLLGRINYSFKDKYLLTISFRRDGSSKFSEGNKWSNFSSFAVAWRIAEEDFIKDLNIFSNLKLRTSYGETGNQGISAYATRDYMIPAKYPINSTLHSGYANEIWRGPANPSLRWETTQQWNGGIDIGFLDNKINLTADVYYKNTRDLLQRIQIPMSTGFASMVTNSGNITNQGVEISGNFYILTKAPLTWNIDANISFNRNKIEGLKEDQFAQSLWTGADQVFLQRNGYPIGTIYGYAEDGFYDNEAEVRADPYYKSVNDMVARSMIGEIKYKNFDDDPAINDKDRIIIGDTNPDFIFGITNNFSWKNFTLNFFIQGVIGNNILNGNLSDMTLMSIGNIPQFIYDERWTAENKKDATWPKSYGGFNRRVLLSDRYVEDGSYIRLKNINIGYTFKKPIKEIESIYIYTSITNLITLTKYSWYDPDVNSYAGDASRLGVDIASYPNSRTFSIGIQCAF